jgi:hypothetical protein
VFAVIIINMSESIYAATSNLPKVDRINTNNVTIINASEVASNNSSLSPIALGSVSVKNLSQSPVTTNFSNAAGLEPVKANTSGFNLSEEKAGTSNITSLANNSQFSLGDLLNNTSNNFTSVNDVAYNANSPSRSVSFELTSAPLSSFTFPMRSLATRSGFEGISFFDTGIYHHKTYGDIHATVPDPQIAVSPTHIGEMVNVAGAFYNKDGELLKGGELFDHSPFKLEDFFKTGTHHITDPRIIYDNSTNRWFALIQDVTDNSVRLSVSAAGDPINSNWHPYAFPFGSRCPDQPSIGISKDKIVISVNVVDDCLFATYPPLGAEMYVIDKSDLINGRSHPNFILLEQFPKFFSLIPAKMSNSNETSDLHLVQIVGGPIMGTNVANSISLVTLSGNTQDLKIKILPINIQNITNPVKAEQPGRESKQSNVDVDQRIPPIDTGDARILDANWHNGKLWLAANDLCQPLGDEPRSCFRLVQVDTSNNTLIQDFDVFFPGKYLFYPSLAIDLSGNLGIVFGVSSREDYPSLFAAIQSVNETKNTLSSMTPLIIGLSAANSGAYGDYFGITIDPNSPNHFWAVGEFIPVSPIASRGAFWSTFVANFTSPVAGHRSLPAETTTAVKYALSVPTNSLRETLPNYKNEEFLKVVR